MQIRQTKQQGLCDRAVGSSVCLTALVFGGEKKLKNNYEKLAWHLGTQRPALLVN